MDELAKRKRLKGIFAGIYPGVKKRAGGAEQYTGVYGN
jgi:hypothetical protein